MSKPSKQVTNAARRKPPAAGMGRKKGSVNKLTKSAKEAFALAFAGIGGAARLQAWAEDNTTEFFKLYARLIPTEVVGDPDKPVSLGIIFKWGATEVPL